MKLAALYSGGKDSNYALYLAQQSGLEVDVIVTLLPVEDSWMYHVPNVKWTELQARALGIKQVQRRAGKGIDAELEALKAALEDAEVDGVVAGAIASDYQYARVNQVCEELGLWVYSPLWRKDPRRLLFEYLEAGLSIMMIRVSAEGLGEEWLGRVLDKDACEHLLKISAKYGVHPAGEGGEFETLVLDGPNFSSRLQVVEAEKVWDGSSGTLLVHHAVLVGKGRTF